VSPTEAIYAALPAFMYLNASITGVLLEPLLEYQSSSGYTNSYAAPDLGVYLYSLKVFHTASSLHTTLKAHLSRRSPEIPATTLCMELKVSCELDIAPNRLMLFRFSEHVDSCFGACAKLGRWVPDCQICAAFHSFIIHAFNLAAAVHLTEELGRLSKHKCINSGTTVLSLSHSWLRY
jgi:hypothetical protein